MLNSNVVFILYYDFFTLKFLKNINFYFIIKIYYYNIYQKKKKKTAINKNSLPHITTHIVLFDTINNTLEQEKGRFIYM